MIADSDTTTEAVSRLRAASRALRYAAEDVPFLSPPITLAVADWLDGEAALLGGLEPFVALLNAAITNASGVIGTLEFGRLEDGSINMRAQSTPAVLRLADLILDSNAPEGGER